MSNSYYDLNGKINLISTNSVDSSSSRIINKYKIFVEPNLTDPLSTLKQMNNILSDQQSNINNKYVCISSFFF
jgi:hypothetical protein